MEHLPVDVYTVADGEEAILFVKRAEADDHAPCPNLAMLDLNLPKKDGFEVLRTIRASRKCKSVPVLIITSSNSPADQRMATELGASYFCKPPSYEEFLKLGPLIGEMLKHR